MFISSSDNSSLVFSQLALRALAKRLRALAVSRASSFTPGCSSNDSSSDYSSLVFSRVGLRALVEGVYTFRL